MAARGQPPDVDPAKGLLVMTWPGELEHQGLLVIANRLVDELRGLRGRLQHANDIEYAQHGDFADRARNLAEYLRAAVLLASTDAYAPAFALVRTALEHMLVDHLVFSGQRYVRIIVGVDDTTSYLWFPGQKPHLYDRIQEANRRAFRVLQQATPQGRQVIDPMSIPDEKIRYYRDPMHRLVDLHSGFQEIMTGLSFISPWPRDDARLKTR